MGTPQELTDAGGKIVWSAHYRAYGNVIKFDINEISNPLRFQGQYYDEESGLHYNRHRYYNPNTGRYLTPDPIKLAGGLNSYQYVPNPTGWVDPLGLMSVEGDCPSDEKSNEISRAVAYENLPRLPDAEEGYVYRGVHKGHPAENDALQGRVTPGNMNGDITPQEHNYGGHSANSAYTSWTRSPEIAKTFAKQDGLILRIRSAPPSDKSTWSWQYSDDEWNEQEVLLKGPRTEGIEVFKP